MSRQTRLAVATDTAEPLDTNTVAELQAVALAARAHLDDLAYTLVAADLVGLCGVRQGDPAVGHDAEIRVADS
jgi:hypothetical protein